MRRDPTEFRERFAKWKQGEQVYENGRAIPGYKKGRGAHQEFVEQMGPALYQELLRTNTPNIDTAYDNMLRQLAYESDYGRSSVAKKQHNYGGYGWNGKTYTTFKDDADFIKHYVELMNNRYNKAVAADSIQAYGKALKDKGYYEDSLEHYTSQLAGMRSLSKYATQHKAQNAGLYALPKEDSQIIQLMNARPQFVPRPTTTQPPIQTDYSIQTMTDPTIPAAINSRSSGDSPLYGGNDYLFRMPNIKEVMERQLFEGLPGYRKGKPQIKGANPTNARFNDDGTFVDDITKVFDDLVITPKGPRVKPGQLYKYQEPWNDVGFMSAITMGLNPLSPVHTGRALYNIATGSGYGDIAKDIFMPNSGLFTNDFYNNHPIIGTVGNIAGDVVAGNIINKGVNSALGFIDRGGIPSSRILNQTDDTMTRLIGTGDSGYKDMLTSGIIRGNKKPTRSGKTGKLHKIAEKLYKILPEDDVRDYLSNNFRNDAQYNKIRDAVKSLDEVKGNQHGGIQLAKKKHWDYPETYDEYIKMTTSSEALEKQNNLMFSRLWSNRTKNPWVENWLPNENVAVAQYDWPNLPTFALSGEKLKNRMFVGDFAVQIKNAHKHGQEAFDFGHFHKHPVTKYPMSYLHPDVSVYRRSDGILTGTKYMKRVPTWRLKYDAYRYKTDPNYTLDISKNYTPMFPDGIPNVNLPYYVGLNRMLQFQTNTQK